MTNDVVDLANLRDMIGNDKELEKELFEEYQSSSIVLLDQLKSFYQQESDNESWKKSAHAFKGIAHNLGAINLGELCKKAQDGMALPANEKKILLEKIEAENKKVIEYLNSQ